MRSLIKTGAGHPPKGSKPPAGHWRRRMAWELAGSQKGKKFGQRVQAKTVMSMLKRNLGDALRARSPRARRRADAFKAVVFDLMFLLRHRVRGSRQRPPDPLSSPVDV